MDATTLARYRETLETMLAQLDADDAAGADAQRTVTLDQQSVGRLSRMDALQQQAMAHAQSARRAGQRKRIVAALKRIDAAEFAYCESCGDEIEARRLALDPTVPRCLDCARG